MARDDKVEHVITFRGLGVQAPVYVVGDFTNPAWAPVEMQAESSENGETTGFTAHVRVRPNQEYHYRFRVGPDSWALKDGAPTALDDDGNLINLLKVPASISVSTEVGRAGDGHHSEEEDDGSPLQTPLLAHETFGDYEFRQSREPAEQLPSASASEPRGLAGYTLPDFDTADPAIVGFPSSKDAVMGTLRSLMSRRPEDGVQPRNIQTHAGGQLNQDGHDASASDRSPSGLPSLIVPTACKRREKRISHGSTSSRLSAGSLGCIMEEEVGASKERE